MSLIITITNEDYYKPKYVNNVYRGGEEPRRPKIHKEKNNKKQSQHNIIKRVTNLFELKKENKAIKNRIIRDIRNLFELQKEKIDSKDLNRITKQ